MNKVVFVCLGNICRSPMAEFIMKALDQDGSLHIESRATSSWEHGNPVHQGTQKILRKYGFLINIPLSTQLALEINSPDGEGYPASASQIFMFL